MSLGEQPPGSSPAPADDLAAIEGLRADLIEAHYTNDGVADLLGEDAVQALDRDEIVPGQLRIGELLREAAPSPCDDAAAPPTPDGPAAAGRERRGRLAVLVAFWLLDLPVAPAQLDAALPRTGAAGLRVLNLLGPEQDSPGAQPACRPAVELRPYQAERAAAHDGDAAPLDLWISSDLSSHQVKGPLPHDHVLGLGRATLTLASATERRPVATALDIGTGCGIHIALLLDHAEHVVATDVSGRALAFARFNLLLNAVQLGIDPRDLRSRVELLQGSLLEPVRGRRFDLVISNPPFVITPRRTGDGAEAARYVYRDAGATGDAVVEELVRGLPALLNPGGTAQLLGNWEIRGEDWAERPRQWAEAASAGTPVDAWFVQRDRQRPGEYAETWLRDASEGRDVTAYRSRYADYLRDFAARGVLEVGFGIVVLHRPVQSGGVPITRAEELTHPLDSPLGPHLGRAMARMRAARDRPEEVLGRALVVAPDVTEERHQRFGAAHPEVILARQGSGLRRTRVLTTAAAGLLGAADGEFALGPLIAAVCSLLDAAPDPAGTQDPESALREEALQLYAEGFLIDPADPADPAAAPDDHPATAW